MTQFCQQLEILHIPCAHLYNIHISEEVDVFGTHKFGNNGQSCSFFSFQKKFQSFRFQSLKIIGGRTRFESAAPEQVGSGVANPLRDTDNLIVVFHGTGTRDQAEVSAADFDAGGIHYRILRMEFPVALLKWLADGLDRQNHIETLQQIYIQLTCISHQSKDSIFVSFRNMDFNTLCFKPVY